MSSSDYSILYPSPRLWIAFDVVYMAMAVIVIAVVTAAAASVLKDQLELGFALGTVLVIGAISLLSFLQPHWIQLYKVEVKTKMTQL